MRVTSCEAKIRRIRPLWLCGCMKDCAKGKDYVNKALEIKPDFPEARSLLEHIEKELARE